MTRPSGTPAAPVFYVSYHPSVGGHGSVSLFRAARSFLQSSDGP